MSVIVPTHNGADTLPIMLEALTGLREPEGGFEILAVDNASSDGSSAILESYEHRLPLSVHHEPEKGKANALNRGIAAARGELLVFTDDDVVPNDDWLLALQRAASEHPEIAVFAGQIRHHWLSEPPDWLRRLADEGRAWGGTPSARREGPMAHDSVKGANFAIRREVLSDSSFRRDLWVAGAKVMVGGVETDFLLKAERAGHKIWYVPAACVRHIISAEEIGVKPYLARWRRLGRNAAAVYGSNPDGKTTTVLGYSRDAIVRVFKGTVRLTLYTARLETHKMMREAGLLTKEFSRAGYLRRYRPVGYQVEREE